MNRAGRALAASVGAFPAEQPHFQLDGGVNLGLNSQTPGVQACVGVSQRF
jgi:hypothetical protein